MIIYQIKAESIIVMILLSISHIIFDQSQLRLIWQEVHSSVIAIFVMVFIHNMAFVHIKSTGEI